MILLTTSQTLEAVMSAAAVTTQLTYVTSWVDESTTTFTLGAVGSSDGLTNNTSSVTITSAPSVGHIRRVSGLCVFNSDTVAAILTVQVNDNGTTRIIWKGLLLDGDSLLYTDQRGFGILNSAGEWRVAISNIQGASSSSSSSVPAHATSHEAGGTDPIPLDALAAPSDVTTLNVTSTKHGLAPKAPADAAQFLNGAATPAYAQVKDADLSTSDVTTNNATTAKHGFMPKFDGTASHYVKGDASQGAIQVADVPTLNQNTSGSAATLTTARTIAGVSFNGSANIAIPATGLSDYATGIWTPSDASGAGLSLTITSAKYIAIGNLVFIHGNVTYPLTANGSAAKIGGLPFTISDDSTGSIVSNSATNIATGEFLTSTTTFQPLGIANAALITNANLSGAIVVFSGCYQK